MRGERVHATIEVRAASGATPARTLYKEAGIGVVPLDESADGKQLVFVGNVGGVRSLHILSRADGKSTRKSTPLFALSIAMQVPTGTAYVYDVAKDGQRFLVSLPVGGTTVAPRAIPLTVTTNWTSLLKQ